MIQCVNKNNVTVLSLRRAPKLHGCVSKYEDVKNHELQKKKFIGFYDRRAGRRLKHYFLRTAYHRNHTPHSEKVYKSYAEIFDQFDKMFVIFRDVLSYKPVFKQYFNQMLIEMFEDRIMYAEVRMNFLPLYGPRNATYPAKVALRLFLKIVKEFKAKHPGFLGIKIISTASKEETTQHIKERIKQHREFRKIYPDIFIGFDLIGYEDESKSLYELSQILLKASDLSLFLHAGETNTHLSPIDNNVMDALLLRAKRIGHGYSISRHPLLLDKIMSKKIPIEICPLSNQIFGLVGDMRTHPAAEWFARGAPLVIGNDNPGRWEAKGVSYDFYFALMGIAPEYASLGTLKKLVWNSIEYSELSKMQRRTAFKILKREWDTFIKRVGSLLH
ncbi:adenosine deaminase 2-like [Scaptodrosophila lebanonensis]|uniref:Adenosine deaminase n=1 Tax=Drosophila lebanonensis TaxID=7225 RepID=A0A6J2T9V3_DROLE|nr:adenosine deaminase 2-like [Scaptodrosophila lebanonensis]